MNYEMLGKRIRDYRKKLHLTQEQLSETANISLSFLGHIERGSRKASLETIVSLSNALNISPHFLLQDSLSESILGVPSADNHKHQQMLQEVSEVFRRYIEEDDE